MAEVTIEYIEKHIDRSDSNREIYWNIEEMCADIGIQSCGYVDTRELDIRCYWLDVWLCTDSWVGSRVYFYKDRLVAISHQSGRKSSEKFFWVKDRVEEVRRYLLEVAYSDKLSVATISLDETLDDYYTVQFNGEVLGFMWESATYNGRKFKLNYEHEDPYGIGTVINVTFEDNNETADISIRDVKFKCPLIT